MSSFDSRVREISGDFLKSEDIRIIQANVGRRCNQICNHCHLEAWPGAGETMSWPTMAAVARIAVESGVELVDITGGAPELNPDLKKFILLLRNNCLSVQVRTNLTALHEKGLDDFARFYRDNAVKLVASLPCYTEQNVRAQRGSGVFERSIESIRKLNSLGYGLDPELQLNIVYNPGGAFLPGAQADLERDYRRELGNKFDVFFTKLLTITNMPIGRFAAILKSQGKDGEYSSLLARSFNPATLPGLMCRHQVCVAWDGTLYDCDFNLALKMPVNHGAPDHIWRFDSAAIAKRRIVTAEHCFGCTAGAGSSCAGALA